MGLHVIGIFLITLLSVFLPLCNSQRMTTFRVGVILDADSPNGLIGNTSLSLALSDFYSTYANYSTRIVLHSRDSRHKVTSAAASALNLLKDVQVDAIIGPQTSAQANFVIGLGDAAKVPVISFTATSPSLRPQTPYFIQTAISDAAQVDAVAAIVKYFRWYQVVFVYEDSDYGNGIIPYLSNAFQQVNARVTYRSVIPSSAQDAFILQELSNMKNMQTRVFVVHTTSALASKIFLKAKEAGMMGEGYVWIVTTSIMNLFYSLNSSVQESMQGVIGVKPLVPGSSKLDSATIRLKKKFADDHPNSTDPSPEMNLYGLWAYDTLWALAMAAEKNEFREQSSFLQNTSALNSTNVFTTGTSQRGPDLKAKMLSTSFEGLTGSFKLVNGQLQPSCFQILNVNGKALTQVGNWTPLLQSSSQRNASMTGFPGEKLENITWPGESRNIPKGWEVSPSGKKLRVGVPAKAGFREFVDTTNPSNITGLYIDLFKSVISSLNYVVEYEFIPFENSDGSNTGGYGNLSYQILYEEYDAIVGDITITANRSEYIDFSLPIDQGGITRTQKINYSGTIDEYFFVKPLERELWLTAIALFIFTGLALWILEHRVNAAFRGPPSEHVGLIFYIPFMSLVYANRERIVSNLARIVIVVWIFIVLILNSTYTASLSAKFTNAKLQKDDTDVSVLIRNGDYVGCREGSFVYDLLKGLGFNESYIKAYKLPEEFHAALSKGSGKDGIKAMFTPTPYTNLFLSKYPNMYMKVGSPYLSEGYAFAFPKGSPLVADVSREIINQTDNHTFSKIKANWTSGFNNDDEPPKVRPTVIGLKSFKILFAITGGVTGACLVVFLVSYFCKNRDFVQRISGSNLTAWSKLRAISKHFDQRDPNSFRSGEDMMSSRSQNVHHDPCSEVVPVSAGEMLTENGDIVCLNSDHITEEAAHRSNSA